VESIVAAATSAIREAVNGAQFLDLAKKHAGLLIRPITGQEEARLVHLAVSDSLDLSGQRALIIDIGGGSVEFIVGSQRDLYYAESIKCGVLRLRDAFAPEMPAARKSIAAMREFILQSIGHALRQARDAGFETVVGTSGTIAALAQLAAQAAPGPPRQPSGPLIVSRSQIQKLQTQLIAMTRDDLRRLDGLPTGRVDTIVPGVVLLNTILEQIDATRLTLSESALREGLILDYLEQHRPDLRARLSVPNPRRRSVLALAERCHWTQGHSRQVASLALSLFDQLQPLHKLDATARELLQYAAWIHDIGYLINPKGHHKHSHYLILNGGLAGFDPAEIQILASLARYHRGRVPNMDDPELIGLSKRARRVVDILAGILRVADGFDRTHYSLVHRLDCALNGAIIDISAHAHGDAEQELWFAEKKSDLLAAVLNRKIRIRMKRPEPNPGFDRAFAPAPAKEDNSNARPV